MGNACYPPLPKRRAGIMPGHRSENPMRCTITWSSVREVILFFSVFLDISACPKDFLMALIIIVYQAMYIVG